MLGSRKVHEFLRADRKKRLEEAQRNKRKCWKCNGRMCSQSNPPCQPQCIACGNARYFLGFTYRIFEENGGTASGLSQTALYKIATSKLIISGSKNVDSLYPRALFNQQFSDCEDVRDMNEWEFIKRSTEAGLETGGFVVRKDLEYSESRGLATAGQSDISDTETIRSNALSRASGASSASLLSAAPGLVSRGASDATLGSIGSRKRNKAEQSVIKFAKEGTWEKIHGSKDFYLKVLSNQLETQTPESDCLVVRVSPKNDCYGWFKNEMNWNDFKLEPVGWNEFREIKDKDYPQAQLEDPWAEGGSRSSSYLQIRKATAKPKAVCAPATRAAAPPTPC